MKALEILKRISTTPQDLFRYSDTEIKTAIAELEALENRSCNNCKYSTKTSGGAYCMCFSMHPDFEYCSDWQSK